MVFKFWGTSESQVHLLKCIMLGTLSLTLSTPSGSVGLGWDSRTLGVFCVLTKQLRRGLGEV